MKAFISQLNEDGFLIYDDTDNQLKCLTARQVMDHVKEIWNLEIRDGSISTVGIDIKRFDGRQGPVPVAVKAYINIGNKKGLSRNKNKVDSYLLVSTNKIIKIKVNSLIEAFKISRMQGKELRVANLKFVYPEGKQPYIVALGADIPVEAVNAEINRVETEIMSILTCNMLNSIVEVSERSSAELNKKINSRGIEPLVKTLEDNGVAYNETKHTDMVRGIISRMQGNVLNNHVYYWCEYRADGTVNFIRYSCVKEKLMIDMSNYLSNLGKNFKKELYKFGQLF